MNKSRIKRNYQEPAIPFTLKAPFKPMGDQPKAIHTLVDGLNDGHWAQVLVGATGTGKTFTMANIIQQVQRPTLIISPNKTLAAQTASEIKDFFLTMRCIILSAIMIIISGILYTDYRYIYWKRILQEMKKSTDCVTRPQWRCLNGGM